MQFGNDGDFWEAIGIRIMICCLDSELMGSLSINGPNHSAR